MLRSTGEAAVAEARRSLTLRSLCPMNRSVPIEANGIIPVSQSDVAGIPPIALSIPDFEGEAILRVFSNFTESEIGCFSAVVTNGASFAHPAAIGTILGLFTLIALGSSFATAVYGSHVPTTRTHYAHSISVFVVFSVFQHIFYTGALSMNWPSVLVAFWSNYAWSAGMIYSESMQDSINQLIGSNKGNISMVGAAATGASANGIGGGYQLSQIYKRSYFDKFRRHIKLADTAAMLNSKTMEQALAKRASHVANSTTGYSWYGSPVKPGLPLPGNFSGFAGTLSEEIIPASNAFMTGFLWWLILAVLVAAAVVSFKCLLEALSKAKLIKNERLAYFRTHWLGYATIAVLRTCFIAFFMMMFLTLFQFTYKGSAGVTAIAALVFLIFFVGMLGVAGYACFYRLRYGRYETVSDRLHLEKTKRQGINPGYGIGLDSKRSEDSDQKRSAVSVPWWRINYISEDPQRMQVHEDEEYTKKFGWLASRFRRTRWWFFTAWLVYEFIRACFYGGAAGNPMTQVFGLLVVEFIAFIGILVTKPFEASRLNALVVYLLGFSKIATVALSAAFDSQFGLDRIKTTVIGIVIIVIQGILTILLMIAIAFGAISSYISVMRDSEDFKPRKLENIRQRYYSHLEKTAPDVPPPPPPPPEEPKEPYFAVKDVRRIAKIEDEDEDYAENKFDPSTSQTSVGDPITRGSRANSMKSSHSVSKNLPFGARVHRASWSSRDFINHSQHDASNRNSQLMSRTTLPTHKASDGSLRDNVTSQRFASPQRAVSPLQGASTPQRGRSTPQRVLTPQGLPVSAMSSPRDSGVLDVKKTGNGKEKAVDFAAEDGKETVSLA